MQIASNFEGSGSPFGALRVMPQFSEASPRNSNSSHIQELYQNLPQLQKAIYLPITYKSFDVQNTLPIPYSEHLQPTPSSIYAKLQGNKPFYIKQRQEPELDKDQIMHKRNGWGGWSGGGGDAGHHHKHGNSPALSALALLGFMFFLQLIQNSLQNNRQLLAAAALNATTVGIVTGRENRYISEYHNRHKRSVLEDAGIHETQGYGTKVSTERNNIYMEKQEKPNNEQGTFSPGVSSENNISSTISIHNKKTRRNPAYTKWKNNPIEMLRSSSVYCCQLIACKLGESIYDRLDTATGLMIRMLGATMIPRIPKKTWTGRLLRAFDKGWKKESCDSLYRNCGVLYNLFYDATNTIQARRQTKLARV